MTMIVFQEHNHQFHPCHDSKLTVKVNQQQPPPPPPPETPTGWGCLQALSINETKKGIIDDVIYVHPLSKGTMPWAHMTSKSLEMCTETLGSETGSDDGVLTFDGEDEDDVQPESPTARERRRLNLYRKSSPREFPPPLATVSGSDGIRIRAKRDGGRLVMEAYSAPLRHCYVVADRSHGRLRLSLMTNNHVVDCVAEEIERDNFDDNHDIHEANECVDDLDTDKLDEEELVELQEEPMEEPEEESEDITAEKEAVERYESQLVTVRGVEEIKLRTGGRIGISEFQRPISRCKEKRDKIFMNWESFWVATS